MADTTDTKRERREAARAARAEQARADAAKARQRKRLWQLGGAIALAAAIVVVIVIATSGGGNDTPALRAGESVPGSQDAAALFRGIPQRGLSLGDPRAPITMVEFADLQCPFCREYTAAVLPTLVEQYVRTGRMRMEFRNLAFIGTDSTRAAQMAEAVGLQNRLWTFIDTFYANQGEENSGYVTDDFLRRIAGSVEGVNVQRAMDDRGIARVQRLLTDASNEASANGISATPSFLIGRTGGTLEQLEVSGLTPDRFTTRIDAAIARAQR